MKLSPADFPNRRALQRVAIQQVEKAVKGGHLSKLNGLIPCVACSRPATEYDHRDYCYPLQVEAVCHSCNLFRGKANPLTFKTWGMVGVESIVFALPIQHKRQLEAMAQKTERPLAALLRFIVKQFLDGKGTLS